MDERNTPIENHDLVQGQVAGDYNTIHQHFYPPTDSTAPPVASPQFIWNVPYSRNPFFTGREGLLERLHTHLRMTKAAALGQPQAISGLGGIGKTQLALEYAYRYRSGYQAILWARAETTEALKASYMEIARLLQFPQKSQDVIIQAVISWLSSTSDWLLILDNADDLAIVPAFLPTRHAGHLLLTTRAQIMGKVAQRFEVDTLDAEAGAALLLRRARVITSDAVLDAASEQDQALALTLTKELGGLPLALDQAGAYIEETACSLADYQQRYQTQRAKQLARRGGMVEDHPEPVATTWSLSFANIEQASPWAAALLQACAFLAPDAIPEVLLMEVLQIPLQPDSDKAETEQEEGVRFSSFTTGQLDEVVALLRAYSLVHRNAGRHTLSVHRLVQVVLLDAMDERKHYAWTQRIHRGVDQFLLNRTHQMRHTLTEIHGYLERLRDENGHLPVEQQTVFLDNALGSGEELITLITSVSDTIWIMSDLKPSAKWKHDAWAQHKHLSRNIFLETINHELRTRLTEVHGYAELLREYNKQIPSEKQIAFLDYALGGCEELTQLITNIPDIMQVHRNLEPPTITNVCLAAEVREVVSCFDPYHWDKYTLHLNVPDSLVIQTDTHYLHCILRNLFSHLFTSVPTHTSISVSAKLNTCKKERERDGTIGMYACISMKDEGPDISPHEVPYRFDELIRLELFRRLQCNLSEGVCGRSLGLYESMQMVEVQGGRIWTEGSGKLGEGALFCFTLPAVP